MKSEKGNYGAQKSMFPSHQCGQRQSSIINELFKGLFEASIIHQHFIVGAIYNHFNYYCSICLQKGIYDICRVRPI